MYDFISSYWPLLLVIVLAALGILLQRKGTFFYWAARIIAILDIFYLTWESIVVGNGNTLEIVKLISITSLPLLIILIVAWKNDLLATLGFNLVGFAFLVLLPWGDFPIGFVPILTGILFGVEWYRKRKMRNAQ